MLQNLTGWHALILLAIILLVFGAAKLPALAKGVGQAVRVLKDEVADAREPRSAETPASPVPADAAASDEARLPLVAERAVR